MDTNFGNPYYPPGQSRIDDIEDDDTELTVLPPLMPDQEMPVVITPLADLVSQYRAIEGELKIFADDYEFNTKALKERKSALREEITKTLQSRGELSVRLPQATVTLALRTTPFVENEELLIKELKRRKLKDYFALRPTELFLQSVLKTIKKPDEFKGVGLRETSYLSFRNSDKKLPQPETLTLEEAK